MKGSTARALLYYPVTRLHGENIGKYLREYRDFQYREKNYIQSYQLDALHKLITHAYLHSSFYAARWRQLGVNSSSIRSLADLKKFPTITKANLVSDLDGLIAGRVTPLWSKKTTGGSTGQVVTLYKNPDALARERAATWRAYQWAGLDVGDPQARFWGVPIRASQRLKYRLIDFVSNRVRFSAFDFSAVQLYNYQAAIAKFRPKYLYGYVSLIAEFSDFLKYKNLQLPDSVVAIITTSEVLTDHLRVKIEANTGVRVFNEYGCGEVGSIAHQCEKGGFHLMEDNLLVEVDESSGSGEGELIVTDLFNYATPLIRYRLGDFAGKSDAPCSCGRTLGVLKNVRGRAYDCIRTSDGRVFHPEFIMYIFEDLKEKNAGIAKFQVIQNSCQQLEIRIVKGKHYRALVEEHISKAIHAGIDPKMQIEYQYVDQIKREASGKLRLVKSNVQFQKSIWES